MAERGRTCGDCANWKVRGSPCTYYDSITRGVLKKTDRACEDFEPAKGKQKPKPHKTCGLSDQGYFEAIYHESKPAFLVQNKGTFSVYDYLTIEDSCFLPKEYPNEYPYEPYGYNTDDLIRLEELFLRVRAEFDLFLDVEAVWKDFLAACVLLSYQQEKLLTVPYVYFVGDNESGKTVALNLLNWLCYRPMLGVTIPSADTYGYLDDSDAPGTILEDEAQGLQRDLDKAKIYKAGYKRGAVVPRTMITQNKRFIKYFRVFCFKACAAEETPRVKGLMERFIFIPMVEGYPNKDWADFNKQDENRLRTLRNLLLKWRLATIGLDLEVVDLSVKGRLKELWKPIIQIISGLKVENNLRAHLDLLQKERLHEKTNTLEGHIVKVVCELYRQDEPLSFSDIWDALVDDLGGKLDDKKPNKMDTADFGEISKQKIGYRLREVLSGKKIKVRGQTGPARHYEFDAKKLERIAKKYGCSFVPKFPTGTTPDDNTPKKQENEAKEIGDISKTSLNSEVKNDSKEVELPGRVVQLGNSRTTFSYKELLLNAKSLTRLESDYGIETCLVCGVKGRPDWVLVGFDESWGFLCGTCGLALSEKMNNQT